jgi:hypothetical protein
MPTLAQLTRLDWAVLGRRAVTAAAATLADGARRRAAAAPDAVTHSLVADGHARVALADPALIRRAQGSAAAPPAPILAPDAADRQAMRIAIIDRLREDLP